MRYQPQLAKVLPVEGLDLLEASTDFAVVRKYDGFRELLYIEKDLIEVISRSGAEHTYNVPDLACVRLHEFVGTVLDCEALGSDGTIGTTKSIFGSNVEGAVWYQAHNGLAQFVVFDCLRFKGEDLTGKTLKERRPFVEKVTEALKAATACPVMLEELVIENKRRYYEKVVAAGGEGVIVKNLEGVYEQDKRAWFKVKKFNTWDLFVIGFTEGKGKYVDQIGAMMLGAYVKGKIQYVCAASGFDDELRLAMSKEPEKYIGKVVVVAGMEIGTQGGVRHPRFIDFRTDKVATQCVWNET